jgi:hypothetical protein
LVNTIWLARRKPINRVARSANVLVLDVIKACTGTTVKGEVPAPAHVGTVAAIKPE